MKKVIVISIIFAILVGGAVWEAVYSTRLYKDIYSGLEAVEASMNANRDRLDNPETLGEMEKVMKRWTKGKEILFCLGNTTVLRGVDDRLISLDAMIKTNFKDDAFVNIVLCKSAIKAVLNDTHPVPTNLF